MRRSSVRHLARAVREWLREHYEDVAFSRDRELADSLRDADRQLRAGETGSVDDLQRELRAR